ncbi:MAG: ACT domain-containing protein [Faecalibacterium sp.]|nr:ACT domain-containing protein [Faecalibacterium sp.]
MNNLEKRFLLVDAQALPEVFLRVLKAKELLASGEARNISAAARLVGISRSAFYKYKDCIYDSENSREVVTVMATLLDETGALQNLLAGISAAGASIVTINQSTPENGAAQVAVTIRTGTMQMSVEELTEKLSRQRTVVEVRCGA